MLNIGLEGMMLSSAFTGVVVSAYAQDWFGPETGVAVGPWLGCCWASAYRCCCHLCWRSSIST